MKSDHTNKQLYARVRQRLRSRLHGELVKLELNS